MKSMQASKVESESETSSPQNPVSSEGVDLTQIHALLALTPTERVESLVRVVARLQRLKNHVQRL